MTTIIHKHNSFTKTELISLNQYLESYLIKQIFFFFETQQSELSIKPMSCHLSHTDLSIKILFWNWAGRCVNWFTWIFEKFNLLSESELRKSRSSFENWELQYLCWWKVHQGVHMVWFQLDLLNLETSTLSPKLNGQAPGSRLSDLGLDFPWELKRCVRYWYSWPLIPRWWSWHNSHLPQLRL